MNLWRTQVSEATGTQTMEHTEAVCVGFLVLILFIDLHNSITFTHGDIFPCNADICLVEVSWWFSSSGLLDSFMFRSSSFFLFLLKLIFVKSVEKQQQNGVYNYCVFMCLNQYCENIRGMARLSYSILFWQRKDLAGWACMESWVLFRNWEICEDSFFSVLIFTCS